MPCEHITLPGGATGFACTGRQRQKRCACGAPSTRLCDWKTPGRRSGTCDKPLCERCTSEPAPDKDLCPTHAAEWSARQAARRTG